MVVVHAAFILARRSRPWDAGEVEGRVIWYLWGYGLSWDGMMLVVASNGSSPSSSWRGPANVMADADYIPDAELGYFAASSRLSWAVMSSMT